jgi:phage FluMu protein Com
MSEPIKVGDLVMVVRWPHPCFGKGSRLVFTVEGFYKNVICPRCKTIIREYCATYSIASWDGGFRAIPISWLKRIDPLAEPERITTDDEVTA